MGLRRKAVVSALREHVRLVFFHSVYNPARRLKFPGLVLNDEPDSACSRAHPVSLGVLRLISARLGDRNVSKYVIGELRRG
jgi:hypothetical protein